MQGQSFLAGLLFSHGSRIRLNLLDPAEPAGSAASTVQRRENTRMLLEELYPLISPFTKILILTKLETGTAESFDIEITRGGRAGGCRKEYYDWLFSLGLEVECLTVCAEDTCGNKEMLCIHCKPIKLKSKVNKSDE